MNELEQSQSPITMELDLDKNKPITRLRLGIHLQIYDQGSCSSARGRSRLYRHYEPYNQSPSPSNRTAKRASPTSALPPQLISHSLFLALRPFSTATITTASGTNCDFRWGELNTHWPWILTAADNLPSPYPFGSIDASEFRFQAWIRKGLR